MGNPAKKKHGVKVMEVDLYSSIEDRNWKVIRGILVLLSLVGLVFLVAVVLYERSSAAEDTLNTNFTIAEWELFNLN